MKVTRNNPEHFVLDHVPWVLSVVLTLFTLIFAGVGLGMLLSGDMFGVMFLVVGGGLGVACMAVFIERIQLILDRNAGQVRLRKQSLFGYSEDKRELAGLHGAIVETSRDSSGRETFRPALVVDTLAGPEAWPVSQVFSSGRGARKAVEAINAWLGVEEEQIPKAFR